MKRNPLRQIENMQELAKLVATGKIHPQVTESFALDNFAKAFAVITERRALGKVVLTMS